jgi:hypothetical protein
MTLDAEPCLFQFSNQIVRPEIAVARIDAKYILHIPCKISLDYKQQLPKKQKRIFDYHYTLCFLIRCSQDYIFLYKGWQWSA